MAKILGIESSCDETAAAVIVDGVLKSNIISSQASIHAQYGGVMPEIASRLHVENIGVVLREAIAQSGVTYEELDAIAVTRGPGLIGSLHVGLQAAKTLALLYKKPLIPVHHLAGHIYANEFVGEFHYPLLALVVSGGNTEIVYMKEPLSFEIIGETKDDAVGECFDKVARVLGLPYPGGLPIDRLGQEGKDTYPLPEPLKGQKTYDFSYSGLKTGVLNLVNHLKEKSEEIRLNDLCRSFEEKALTPLVEKTMKAAKEYKVRQVIIAGGVSANTLLRAKIKEATMKRNLEVLIPPLWCTTDNAAMIAKVGEKLYSEKLFAPLTLGVDPNWLLKDFRSF